MGQPKMKEPAIPEAPKAPPPPPPPPTKKDADVQEEKRAAVEKKKYQKGRESTLLKQTGYSNGTKKKTLLGA